MKGIKGFLDCRSTIKPFSVMNSRECLHDCAQTLFRVYLLHFKEHIEVLWSDGRTSGV